MQLDYFWFVFYFCDLLRSPQRHCSGQSFFSILEAFLQISQNTLSPDVGDIDWDCFVWTQKQGMACQDLSVGHEGKKVRLRFFSLKAVAPASLFIVADDETPSKTCHILMNAVHFLRMVLRSLQNEKCQRLKTWKLSLGLFVKQTYDFIAEEGCVLFLVSGQEVISTQVKQTW